ncbi:Major facilitator superfamily transporter [Penicillium herquei]|nr:Major facilitator superfamily transporter [Penicillium herquei]
MASSQDKDLSPSEERYNNSAVPLPSTDASEIQFTQYNQETVADSVPENNLHSSVLRDSLPGWKWTLWHVIIFLGGAISGYDVSNAATIQLNIYEDFGHINLLPWVVTSFSLGVSATAPTVDQIMKLVDLKWFSMACWTVFAIASAVCASAPNMQAVIIGRVILGVAGAGCYLSMLSYCTILARPAEHSKVIGVLGMGYAVGLFLGPIIGGAFAQNKSATWRWAFYICIPWTAIIMVLVMLVCPRVRLQSKEPIGKGLRKMDWIGGFLHAATWVIFDSACIFSGSTLAWDSSGAIALWVLFGVVAICYAIQQHFSIFTEPDRRGLPIGAMSTFTGAMVMSATFCAACGYSVPLYYLPLFYAFTRGDDSFQAAIHILPYIGPYIVGAIGAGILLPRVRRYAIIYMIGGVLITAGAASMQSVDATTPLSQSMGISVLLGFAVGLTTQIGTTVLALVLPPKIQMQSSVLMTITIYSGTTVSQAIAGCIFQNIGFKFLSAALKGENLSNTQIHNALAGKESPVWSLISASALDSAVAAVAKAIIRLFYISTAGGAIMLILAVGMKWEALEFDKPATKEETEKEGRVEETA